MHELPPVSTKIDELLEAADRRHEQAPHSEWYQEMQAEMQAFKASDFTDFDALHIAHDQSETPTQSNHDHHEPIHAPEMAPTLEPSRRQRVQRLGRHLLGFAKLKRQTDIEVPTDTIAETEVNPAIKEASARLRKATSATELTSFLDDITLWNSPDFRRSATYKLASMVRTIVKGEGRAFNSVERAFRAKVLESYGLDRGEVEEMWRSWTSISSLNEERHRDSKKMALITNTITGHLGTMERLEEMVPGSVQALRRDFGIRHFGRYHEEDLQWQLRNPYAKADAHLTATEDHNAAMENAYADVLSYAGNSERELAKRRVFLEAATVAEAGTRLHDMAQYRGAIRKLYISAHSGETRVILSDSEKGSVTPANVREFIPSGTMQRGGEIVIFGCESERLAKAIAHTADVRVIGTKGKVADMYKSRLGITRFSDAGGASVKRAVYGPGRVTSGLRRIRRVPLTHR